MPPRLAKLLPLIAALASGISAPGAQAGDAPDAPAPSQAHGLLMLDYQTIPIKGRPSIDLVGTHVLQQFSDGLYAGIGIHAPLVKGEYGGLMAFDVTLHAERRLSGNLYGDVGASLGGGAGGNSAAQAKVIAGAGGFVKTYAGLGYHFDGFSAGVNLSRVRFTESALHGSQLDFFVQLPFSYSTGSYGSSGQRRPADAASEPDTNIVMLGLDNFIQIRPQGSYRQTVNLVDVQVDHFLNDSYYVLFEGSVGYRGLPTYNQILGGVGYRHAFDRRFKLYTQLALGSGGYAPEKIDTGPGLLLYPKLIAEYRLSENLGVALSGGYLYAPKGSSKNITVGASLTYHLSPDGGGSLDGGSSGHEVVQRGFRFHVFQQTEFDVKVRDHDQGAVRLLSLQLDHVVSDHLYVPVQASIAYSRFLGYPGYGELLTGVGIQSRYSPDHGLQAFAQLLAGINIHGLVLKPAVGLNWGLSDRLALYAQAGKTFSVNEAHLYPRQYAFSATSVGLGLSYRFSLPL
ncbi:MAG TPA: hypothetical protein VGM81_03295 [Burkholderiaceae bacterium]